MTQLPSITDRLIQSSERAQQTRDTLAGGVANPFDRLYFDAQGEPTFEKPTTGTFGAIGKSIYLSQEATDSLSFGAQAVLRSGAEMISDLTENTVDAPIAAIDGNLLLDGKQVPLSDATARQAFDTLPPATQLTLEMGGYGKDDLHKIGINTAEDLQERWSGIVYGSRARQALESFKENSNGFQRFASGAGGLATDIVTDPLFALTLVFTAGTATAARAGAKESGEALLKKYIADGIVKTAIGRTGIAERRVASRALFWGSGAAYTGAMSTGYQTAQGLYDMENNLLDASEGLTLSSGELAFSGVLGAFFGELSFRSLGLSSKPMTRETYRAYSDVEDFSTYIMSRDERLGFRSKDELISDLDIESYEVANEFAKRTLNSQQFNRLTQALADDDGVGEIDISELSSFMLQLPDGDELDAFLKGTPPTVTRFAQLTLDVIDLDERVRKAAAAGDNKTANRLRGALRTAVSERDVHVKTNLNVHNTNETPVAAVIAEIANQIPVGANETTSARIARIQQINTEGLRKASENIRPRAITPAVQRIINKSGGKFLNPTQQVREAMYSDDPLEAYVSLVHGLIDNTGFDATEHLVNVKKSRILSTAERVRELETRTIHPIRREYEQITKKMSAEEAQEFGFSVLKAVDAGDIGNLPTEWQSIARRYSRYFDDLGNRGVGSGYLKNKLDNFISLNYNRNADYARDVFVDEFINFHTPRFNPDDLTSPVNYNALSKIGYARREGGGFLPKGDLFDELPTKVSDIPEEILEDYKEALSESLASDAESAFTRLTGHHERLSADPDDPDIRKNSRLRPNPQNSRKMEQSFYLSDAMRDSGLVDYDLMKSVDGYARTSGYNILRDESLSDFYGQPINYHEWMRATRNMAQGNVRVNQALDRLESADKIQAGRFRVNDDGAVFAATLQNVVASIVNAGIVPTIASTELAGSLLRNIIRPKSLTDYTSSISSAIRNMSKDQAQAIGILFERETNRFTGDVSEFVGQQAKDHWLVRSSASLSRASRLLSGERLFTTMSKSVHFGETYSKLYYRRRKLNKLLGLEWDAGDLKSLKGAARTAGMDPDNLQRLQTYGILEDEMIGVAEALTAIDSKALRDRKRLSQAAEGLTKEQKILASQLDQRLTRMAADDAESFVATATANSKVAVENPLYNMILQFTSFGRAFQNRAVTRAATAPYWKQFTALNFLISAEITNAIFRDILYNGHSPETVVEKWEEDPLNNLALVLSRLPVYGPMNPLPYIASGMAGGRGMGLENMTGSPALGMASRALGSGVRAGTALLNGEDVSAADFRTLDRIAPGHNFWYTRLIEEGAGGFEEDLDR